MKSLTLLMVPPAFTQLKILIILVSITLPMPIPSTPMCTLVQAHTHPLIHREACCQMILLSESPSLHLHSHHPKWGTHHFSPTVLQCHANLCSARTLASNPSFHITTEFIFLLKEALISFICLETISSAAIKLIFLEKTDPITHSFRKWAATASSVQ